MTALQDELNTTVSAVAGCAEPLGKSQLVDLARFGVALANHGWRNADLAVLSPRKLVTNIDGNRRWIQEITGTRADCYYAVPFGDTVPTHSGPPQLFRTCFLLRNDDFTSTSAAVVNRKELLL
jgi:peptidoglycan/xylan/chitin deacetylase (PgdA/CDA1 family)